jgi:hypothetical protein
MELRLLKPLLMGRYARLTLAGAISQGKRA